MVEELAGTIKKKQPGYLLWYDDDPKIPTVQKIQEALEAYVKSKRWRQRPNVVLVNEADVVTVNDVTVRCASHVRRNHFWIGREETGVEEEPQLREEATAPAAPSHPSEALPAVEPTVEPVASEQRPTRKSRSRVQDAPIIDLLPPVVEQGGAERPARKGRGKMEVAPVAEVLPPPVVEQGADERPARKGRSKVALAEAATPEATPVAPVAEVALRQGRGKVNTALADEVLPPVEQVAEERPARKGRSKGQATPAAEVLPPVVEQVADERPARKGRGKAQAAPAAEVLPAVVEQDVEERPTRRERGKVETAPAKELSPAKQVAEPVVPAEGPARKVRQGTREASIVELLPPVEQEATPLAAPSRLTRKRSPKETVQTELEQASLPL